MTKQTAYIVGRGPSLLTVTAAEFDPGPVVALNRGIEQVRALNLPNPIYAMAKDGCIPGAEHGGSAPPSGHACTLDIRPPETVVLSLRESVNCLPDYPDRIVVDVEGLGLPWYFQSAAVAAKWLISLGYQRIVMVAHDAYLTGDTTRVEGDQLIDDHDGGYVETGHRAQRIATDAGIEMVWRPVG